VLTDGKGKGYSPITKGLCAKVLVPGQKLLDRASFAGRMSRGESLTVNGISTRCSGTVSSTMTASELLNSATIDSTAAHMPKYPTSRDIVVRHGGIGFSLASLPEDRIQQSATRRPISVPDQNG
jgi:hypothetical protein